ncbi:transmembrane protein [Ralstonia solanacearum]|nr:transmembrane protein [Ralstonia solanacearum]
MRFASRRHRVRWMWASHVTHHASEGMHFSTEFRQSLTYPISVMWLFWLPLAWIGFTPDWVIAVAPGFESPP